MLYRHNLDLMQLRFSVCSRAQGGPKPGAALAAAAALLLVLLTAAGLAGIRNSWGSRWLLQRSCKPPGASERLGAWGELHGLNHTISTQSGEAQRLFNQVGRLLALQFSFIDINNDSARLVRRGAIAPHLLFLTMLLRSAWPAALD